MPLQLDFFFSSTVSLGYLVELMMGCFTVVVVCMEDSGVFLFSLHDTETLLVLAFGHLRMQKATHIDLSLKYCFVTYHSELSPASGTIVLVGTNVIRILCALCI